MTQAGRFLEDFYDLWCGCEWVVLTGCRHGENNLGLIVTRVSEERPAVQKLGRRPVRTALTQ